MRERQNKDWEDPCLLHRLYMVARDGGTIKECAKSIGCGKSTLDAAVKKHKTVRDMIKKGRSMHAMHMQPKVEAAILKSLLGGYVTEVKEEQVVVDGIPLYEDEEKKIPRMFIKARNKKYIPANVTAQIFFAVNRLEGWKSINHKSAEDNLDGLGEVLKFIQDQIKDAPKKLEEDESN